MTKWLIPTLFNLLVCWDNSATMWHKLSQVYERWGVMSMMINDSAIRIDHVFTMIQQING